ncbi:MAG: TetR/AcrR family transcriptional regulator [Bacteroidota bacterium]
MVTKADRTRQFIIEKAAPIFNKKGFSGTSMSDVLEATGLAKGGLYGNFDSKEELGREVFAWLFNSVYAEIVAAASQKSSPIEKLIAICDFHKDYTRRGPAGGCPILNFSVEVDDTMPRLKKDVREGIEKMLNDLYRVIEKGKRIGEIRKDINSEYYASMIYAQIEGAIFLAKALDEPKRLNQSIEFLKTVINNELRA